MSKIQPPRLLIVDDDKSIRYLLKEVFEKENYELSFAASPRKALELAKKHTFDIALIDFKLPEMDGLELMTKLKKTMENLIVIFITAYGSKELIQEVMNRGAYDFFTKPIDINDLRFIIRRSIDKYVLVSENLSLKKSLEQKPDYEEIIGSAPSMQALFDKLEKVFKADVDVLISGESGTGKELIAEVIHKYSNRSGGPMVEVNCAAIPDTLLESELFGHEKGAFTDAKQLKIGKFERANHGTIFLDEISEISIATQGKLLRAIQEREIERLGGSGPIKLDFRLIAATNRDLLTEVQEERFREDLYYRLNVIQIHIPPLRERREDIAKLAAHFLNIFCRKFEKSIQGISKDALQMLEEHPFPGNVRQLENMIQQAVVLSDKTVLEPDCLQLPDLKYKKVLSTSSSFSVGETMEEVVDRVEKEMILQTLRSTGWKQQETADILKISRKSLYNKIKKYNLTME